MRRLKLPLGAATAGMSSSRVTKMLAGPMGPANEVPYSGVFPVCEAKFSARNPENPYFLQKVTAARQVTWPPSGLQE